MTQVGTDDSTETVDETPSLFTLWARWNRLEYIAADDDEAQEVLGEEQKIVEVQIIAAPVESVEQILIKTALLRQYLIQNGDGRFDSREFALLGSIEAAVMAQSHEIAEARGAAYAAKYLTDFRTSMPNAGSQREGGGQ